MLPRLLTVRSCLLVAFPEVSFKVLVLDRLPFLFFLVVHVGSFVCFLVGSTSSALRKNTVSGR